MGAIIDAPATWWVRQPMGLATWWRLHVTTPDREPGRATPYFVSRDPHDRGPDRESPYQVLASGMHAGGCALGMGHFRRLKDAQARALALAEAEAGPADRATLGNVTFLIGDRVVHRHPRTGFFFTKQRQGVIVDLTTGLRCWVRWDGEPQTEHRLDLLLHTGGASE